MRPPPHTIDNNAFRAAGWSQLQMTLSCFDALPAARTVGGYALRGFREDDRDAWRAILNAGDFGTWNPQRLDAMLAGERAPLPREGVVFATRDDRPVGVANAFAYDRPDGRWTELGGVAVLPEHRGRGLAVGICRGVLAFARDAGFHGAFLSTEDFRLGAIKTYLRLGFEPPVRLDKTQPSDHSERWNAIFDRLGVPHSD